MLGGQLHPPETARLSAAIMVDALGRRLATHALAAALPQITAARDSRSGRSGMLERLPWPDAGGGRMIWRLGPVFLQALASLAVIASLIDRYVLILGLTLGFLGATWMGAARHVHADATNAAASHVSRTIGDIVAMPAASSSTAHSIANPLCGRDIERQAARQRGHVPFADRHGVAAFCIVGAGLVAC
jgi:hypothetical protein